jgi:peptidoglycan hydrolase CwlO-like protein
MKYKEQAQRKIEALQNQVELLSKQIGGKQITGEEAINMLKNMKRLLDNLDEMIALEYA